MNCEECAENLTSLVFDEVSEDTAMSMHEHIAECDSCRELYMELIETQASLESAIADKEPIVGLSQEHKDKIQEALVSEVKSAEPAKGPIYFPSWLMAVAACLVVGVIVFNNSRTSHSEDMAKNESQVAVDAEEAEKSPSEFKKQALNKSVEKSIPLDDAKEKSSGFKAEMKNELADAVLSDENAKNSGRKAKLLAEEPVPEALEQDKVALLEEKEVKKKKDEVADLSKRSVAPKPAVMMAASIPEVDFESIQKMLVNYEKTDGLSKEVKEAVQKIKSLKKEQLQLTLLPSQNTKNSAGQKILVRILDNAKKAIDYAHIFVHNQNIIRVERVR